MRILTLAAGLALFAAPGCIIASRNNATTQDIAKPPSDPPVPESRLVTVALTASGLTDPPYETAPDQIFVIRDIRLSEPCDVLIELGGVPPTLQLPYTLFDEPHDAPNRFYFKSPAGLRLPGGAKLRLRPVGGRHPAEVIAFLAGDLIRG